jgi:SulP family sulfate permease
VGEVHLWTLSFFVVGFIFLLIWKKYIKAIPGVIVLAPVGILLGYLSQVGIIDVQFQTLFSKFGDISGSLWSIPKINFIFNKEIISGALAVSLVAILETLLSAKIADGMTKTKHSSRKEVLGLGLANIASGIFGGIPATAALARTSVNIKSGASDRMSATISSLCVLIISVAFLFLFKYLPLAVVASVLVFTAMQMVELKHFAKIYRNDKSAMFVFVAVAIITVVEDPMMGILAGATMALLIFANKMASSETEITLNKNKQIMKRVNAAELVSAYDNCDVVVYRFAGQLNYVNSQSHANNLALIDEKVKTVILSLRNLFSVDMDGADSLGDAIESLENRGKKVFISAANGSAAEVLNKENWFRKMHDENHVFPSTQDALTMS